MNSYRLIIFDLDGVLVDTTPCHARAFDQLWRELGIPGPPYETLAGQTTRETVANVTAPLAPTPGQVDAWTARKQSLALAILEHEDVVFPDTLAAMRSFIDSGLPLALGTAASRASAELALRRLGLEGVLSPVVTAADVERGKPDPEVYLRVLDQARTAPEDALVVEDSTAGLQAAVDSGAWVASVRTGRTSASPRFVGAYPDLRTLVRDLGLEAA